MLVAHRAVIADPDRTGAERENTQRRDDSLGGLRYDVKDRTAAVEQALKEAMQFARLKANALATAAGRTVGMALIISEYNSRPPRTVSVAGTRGGTSGGAAAADAASYVPVEPPTLDADARITVTFELI